MKFILKYFFIFFMINSFAFAQISKAQNGNRGEIMPTAAGLIKKKKYQDAIDYLGKNIKAREENASWYYYYGLALGRLDRYDEAIESLDQFIKKTEISNSAPAFYLIGLMHFYKGQYDKALSNLDASLDVSKDPKLDKSIDVLIDKVIRYQNYYQNRKASNISFLIGYGYYLNTLNLSQKLSQEKLDGHIMSYGVSLSHRLVDNLSFIFEPSVTISDSYTLDSKFKANSTLQEGDVLQAILTLPVVFTTDKEQSSTQYEVSANAYTAYAAVADSRREQYIAAYFLKARVATDLNAAWSFNAGTTFAQDQSLVFLTEDAKSNGTRVELVLGLSTYLNKEKDKGAGVEYTAVQKGAEGKDARYATQQLTLAYWFPSLLETNSVLRLGYAMINYPDRILARKDNNLNFDYFLSQSVFDDTATLSYFLGLEENESNYDLNTYENVKVGLALTKRFGF